jgi:hypothetical protein
MPTLPPEEDLTKPKLSKPEWAAQTWTTQTWSTQNLLERGRNLKPLPLLQPEKLVDLVGNPRQESLHAARTFLEKLSANLHEASKSWEGVRAILIGLFYSNESEVFEKQKSLVRDSLGETAVFYSVNLVPYLKSLLPGERLPLIELCAPAARTTPKSEQIRLVETLHGLAMADGNLHLLEFSLLCLIENLWNLNQSKHSPFSVAYLNTFIGKKASSVLISALFESCNQTQEHQDHFEKIRQVAQKNHLEIEKIKGITSQEFEKSLLALSALVPAEKQKLFEILIFAAQADGEIQPEQKEILQVVSCALGIPLSLVI